MKSVGKVLVAILSSTVNFAWKFQTGILPSVMKFVWSFVIGILSSVMKFVWRFVIDILPSIVNCVRKLCTKYAYCDETVRDAWAVSNDMRALLGSRQGRPSSQSRHYTALWYADCSVIKIGMDLQERKIVSKHEAFSNYRYGDSQTEHYLRRDCVATDTGYNCTFCFKRKLTNCRRHDDNMFTTGWHNTTRMQHAVSSVAQLWINRRWYMTFVTQCGSFRGFTVLC